MLEIESVFEKLLQHLLNLVKVCHARQIGLSINIEPLSLQPRRTVYDLRSMDRIGEGDQIVDCLALDHKAMAADDEVPGFIGIGRLDGGNFKGRMRVFCHRRHRRNRWLLCTMFILPGNRIRGRARQHNDREEREYFVESHSNNAIGPH